MRGLSPIDTLESYCTKVRARIVAKELLKQGLPARVLSPAELAAYKPVEENPRNLTLAQLESERIGPDFIKFYRTADWYGEFSNFADYVIKLMDKDWPTSEHFFQAMKFIGTIHEEEVRKAPKPGRAFAIGGDRKRPLRPDWDKAVDFATITDSAWLKSDWQRFVGGPMLTKDYVMLQAVRAKFTQYEELGALLLSTGTKKLIEHTTKDRYWADGGDGSGKNLLGKILMLVREELRRQQG
jgi:predicted NAD-dependent protein-ADP-ribosyltransferase YbiA (DUF1768 family)